MNLKETMGSITRKEWRLVILLAVVMIIITTIPYIYGYLNTPDGYYYRGIHSLTPGDYPVYYSNINQIKDGSFLLKDNFTHEFQSRGVLNLFWLEVGLIARVFHLPDIIAFQLYRIILIPIFLGLIYLFFSYFFKDKLKRKLAFIFILFSSGVGAFLATHFEKSLNPNDPIYQWPIDLWVAESNVFLTLYQSPHFIMSLICMMLFSLFMLESVLNNRLIFSLYAGLVGLYWFNFHPYYFPYIFIVMWIYVLALIVKTQKLKPLLNYFICLIVSSPFVIYHYWLIKTDEVIGGKAMQNLTLSPDLVFIIAGFGFLFLCAFFMLMVLIEQKKIYKNKMMFLVVWAVAGFVLLYSPFPFQRRFLMGLQIPLVIFTVMFITYFYKYIQIRFEKIEEISKNKTLYVMLFVILFCFSSLFNLVRDVYFYQAQMPIFYLPNEYKDSFAWLKENNKDKTVFSHEFNSQAMVRQLNQNVYFGHEHETIKFREKEKIVNKFYNNEMNDQEVKDFFNENNIGYVFDSKYPNLEKVINFEEKIYLEKVHENNLNIIYKYNIE